MSAKTNNFNISRYFLYHKDGLLDIFIGLYLIIAGGAVAADMTFLSGAWIAMVVPLWISARKSITMRRVSPDQLPHESAASLTAFTGLMIGLFVAGIAVGGLFQYGVHAVPSVRAFLSTYIHLIFGAGLTLLLLVLSALLKTGRLALHALASVIVFATANLFGWPFFVSFMTLGSLIFATGIALVTRFIRQNPLAFG